MGPANNSLVVLVVLLAVAGVSAAGQGKCDAGLAGALAEFVNEWREGHRSAAADALCAECDAVGSEELQQRCTQLCDFMQQGQALRDEHPQFGQLSSLLLDLLFHLHSSGCPSTKQIALFAQAVAESGAEFDEPGWHRIAVTVALGLGFKPGIKMCDLAIEQQHASEAMRILKAHLLKRSGRSKEAVSLLTKMFALTQNQNLLHSAFSPRVPTAQLVAKFSTDEILTAMKGGERLLGLASEYNLLKWELEGFKEYGTVEAAPDVKCPKGSVLWTSPLKPRVVVAMPLVASEKERFSAMMKVWDQYPPCTAGTSGTREADLMLLFSGKASELPSWLNGWEVQMGKHKSCFRRVYVSYAGLTKAQIEYQGGWDVTGPNNLLHALMVHNASAHKDYDYAMFMESDVFPIQPGWLDRVVEETAGPRGFWRKGAAGGMPIYTDVSVVSTHHKHMNSNGIYRLGDMCFREILKQVREEWGSAPNDAALHLFMNHRKHFRDWQRYAQKFVYTDLLQNWLGDWCRDEVLEISPNTALVHGKHRQESCKR